MNKVNFNDFLEKKKKFSENFFSSPGEQRLLPESGSLLIEEVNRFKVKTNSKQEKLLRQNDETLNENYT